MAHIKYAAGQKTIPTDYAGGGGGSDNIIALDVDNGISITPREAIQAIIDGKIIVNNTGAFDEPITTSFAYSNFASRVYYDSDLSTWIMLFEGGSEIISADIDEEFYVD